MDPARAATGRLAAKHLMGGRLGPYVTGLSTGFSDPLLFLRLRITLFLRTLFGFVTALYVMGWLLALAFVPDPVGLHLHPAKLSHLLSVIVSGALWRLGEAGRIPAAGHRPVEVGAAVFVATALALAAFAPPGALPSSVVIIVVAIILALTLVLRAAIVPSTAGHSIVVGVAATAPLVLVGAATYDAATLFDAPRAGVGAFIPFAIGALFTAATAVVSRTIYGLQTRVREAVQLGQYTLEEKIGQGGMGAVYRARHALLRRPTAIKLLPPEKAGERAIRRFEQEVQQTARLTHPNTVAIYDYGLTADGVFYYAMEYLEGLSLEELVALDGPQPAGRVIHLLAQVADALAEAHGAGLVHRDVKPGNVIVCERGGQHDVAKVVDFGLVKELDNPGDVDLTGANVIAGTPLYLAPEALRAPKAIGSSMDLYALGAVAYFLLTGAPVFEAATVVEVCGHHLHTAPVPPSQRASVPADLETVVLRCLAKEPAERYPSAAALREALLACAVASEWGREHARRWWEENRPKLRARRDALVAAASTELAGVITVELAGRGAA